MALPATVFVNATGASRKLHEHVPSHPIDHSSEPRVSVHGERVPPAAVLPALGEQDDINTCNNLCFNGPPEQRRRLTQGIVGLFEYT